MSKFFINRPIVAMVISIVMVLVGGLTMLTLPVAQFPNLTPPEIQILASWLRFSASRRSSAVMAGWTACSPPGSAAWPTRRPAICKSLTSLSRRLAAC